MRTPKHPSRDAVAKRLKRAGGHLRTVLAMIESKRSSLELAQQLQAVESAVGTAKRLLIHDQMQYCLDRRDTSGGALRELKYLTKFL